MAMNQGVMDGANYREPTHGPENLLRLFALLWRNILIILLSGLLLAAAAFGVSLLIPNYYSATTQILLDPEGSRILESDLTAQPRAVDSHVLNQQYLLTSNELLTRVVEKENLQNDPDFGAYNSEYTDSKSRTQLAVDRLRKAESVAIVGKSFIVNVTVRSSSPEQAAKLANTIADTYLELRSEMNADTLKRTGGGLSAQLEQLRKAVEDGDRAVQAYRATHNLANVAGRPDIEQQISDTNAEIARLSGTIAENEALVSELRQARNDRQYLRSIPGVGRGIAAQHDLHRSFRSGPGTSKARRNRPFSQPRSARSIQRFRPQERGRSRLPPFSTTSFAISPPRHRAISTG